MRAWDGRGDVGLGVAHFVMSELWPLPELTPLADPVVAIAWGLFCVATTQVNDKAPPRSMVALCLIWGIGIVAGLV